MIVDCASGWFIRSVGALELCCAIAFAKASEQMATAISEILEFLRIVFLASNSIPFDSDATHSWKLPLTPRVYSPRSKIGRAVQIRFRWPSSAQVRKLLFRLLSNSARYGL